MKVSEKPVTVEMYCSSCWRQERHAALANKSTSWIWIILTLGIAYFFQPFRCVTCGHERIRGFGE